MNFRRVLPLPKGAKVYAELAPASAEKELQSKELNPEAAGNEDETEFSLKNLKPGTYELRTGVRKGEATVQAQSVHFRYPFEPLPPVASPEERIVPQLSSAVTPPSYELQVAKGGGLKVIVKGQTYRVESSYSYPHGGYNRLLAAASNRKGEDSWKVTTKKLDGRTYEVKASGKYYAINRRIEMEPTHIMVKDTIRNTSDDVVGIILSNYVNTRGSENLKVKMMNNLTAFVHAKDNGVGIIALDDLYQLQEEHRFADGLAELRTQDFGLDKGASYTVEWAVYPTATNDYYDFINQVRKDEGLNRRVEGSFAFVPRRTPPTNQFMELLNLKYTSIGCLGKPPDEPTVSLEGNEGWRWWIFYPTMENSFGKALFEAMHYMVDELGATGMWADGFVSGYVSGGYSYDHWDGHSVTIDPKTKLVTRKKTCVPWVALPVLKKVVRIIDAKGGVTITNGQPGSRSLWKENMIASCEGSEQALIALHLGRAPCSLSSAAVNERSTYRDILKKLEYGSLYFWYRYKMEHKTLVEHMYPITIQSIHAGVVRGKERIVTKKSGIYGWHGDRALHIVYLYDARGMLTRSNFLTTVDDASVRTELKLKKEQSGAVVKLPIILTASEPVNANVRQYDANAIRMVLNGRGEIEVCIKTGDFAVKPGVGYRLTTDGMQSITATEDGVLSVSLTLDRPVTLRIEKD